MTFALAFGAVPAVARRPYSADVQATLDQFATDVNTALNGLPVVSGAALIVNALGEVGWDYVAVRTNLNVFSKSESDAQYAAIGTQILPGTGLTGGGDLTVNRTLTLADTAVTPGTYGDATHVMTATVDQQGRITAASSVSISAAGLVTSVNTRSGAVTGLAEDSAVVHLTGGETVAGVKTFSSAPIVPSGAFPETAIANLGTDLAFPSAQDVARRSGSLGAASIAVKLAVDVVIGDSLGRGAGGTFGATDWATVAATVENRRAGLGDPGPGLVLCNEDESIYGSLKWSDLSAGAAGTTGPSAGAGTTPATNWVLSTSGQTIGDTRAFRRAVVFYEKQASSAATIQISTDGGSTWSSDQSTTGSGYGTFTSADLGTATSRNLKVKTTSAGSARIIGARYYQTAGTTGSIIDNVAKGGTTSADWTANRGWETWCTLVTPRRIFISVGVNDQRGSVSASTFQTNLTTLVTRAQAAAPLAEIVITLPYYADTTSPLGVGNTTWASTWVPVYKAVALANGCTLVNEYDRFGNCSAAADPYALTIEGLHFGDSSTSPSGRDGQRARAELYLEKLSYSRSDSALPAVLTEAVSNGMGTGWKTVYPRSGGALWLFDWDVVGDGSLIVASLGIGAAGDAFPRTVLAQAGVFYGDGTASPDALALARADSTHLVAQTILGTLVEVQGHDPTGSTSFGTKGYNDAHYATLAGPTFTTSVTAPMFVASGLTGATAASRYVGATTTNHPTSGTFATGDHSIAQDGYLWICTAGGTPGTWIALPNTTFTAGIYAPLIGPTFTTSATAPTFIASGLTGATAGAAFVGGTTTNHPVTGTFVTGNVAVAQDGYIWICTAGGTPGTWIALPNTAFLAGIYAPTIGPTFTGTLTAGTAALGPTTATTLGLTDVLSTTGGTFTLGDGTGSHGEAILAATTAFGPTLDFLGAVGDTVGKMGVRADRFELGPGGSSGFDVSWVRTGAAAATLTGQTTIATGLTFSAGKHIALATSGAGTQIGTGTTQLLGFYGTTATAQPAGSTDVLASLVTLGLRAASSNPPLNLGTGALTAGVTSLGATTSVLSGISTKVANYTMVLADASSTIIMNKATAITLTIPANASVAYPIGTIIYFVNIGVGALALAITTDTLTGTTAYVTNKGGYIIKTAATQWYAFATA